MGLDPGTMSVGMTAISGATNAFSHYQQGQADEARYKYQARQQERQAKSAEWQGEWEEKRLREQGSQVKGAQRAGYAGGNVQVDTGSPLDILAATDREIDMDAAMIRYNTMSEANARRSQADLYRAAGETAKSDSLLKAGSTLITSGARTYRQYDHFFGDN